ncbi:MAG: hypothetical protein JNK60_07940 [Acidobacteria bacterium]|nr:hypothetical protein [Acidobacteriota bacterium]
MRNVYFELTKEFNAKGRIAVLASGQAVVYHRIAIMSKDGDWIIREDAQTCRHVLDVLAAHGARYRMSAPLEPRWLAGGWSSHFEFLDEEGRRIRCDFVSRPPRLTQRETEALFTADADPLDPRLAVIGLLPLIRIKQTQRAKDYAVIGELARRLPPEAEAELTTDPDRILALAGRFPSTRPALRAASSGAGRLAVVTELAREIDGLQLRDRDRIERYEAAAEAYFAAIRRERVLDRPLAEAHESLVTLAGRLLPEDPRDA